MENRRLTVQLNCPMPRMHLDKVTRGHGSGGVLTHKLLDQGVFEILSNEYLDSHHDGAIFDLNGKTAFTTDSFVISPIFFPGGNIGELAVNGTVNDIAMCGAVPRFLSLGFILEEGLPMEDLWEIILGVKKAADAAGVKIVTGDTKVVERGKGDKVFINTTGVGDLHEKARIGTEYIQEGDAIVVSNSIAVHGIAILSVREGLEFETDLLSDSIHLNDIVLELIDKYGGDIRFLRDPTRGGLGTVLVEVARQSGRGIEIEEKLLPLDERIRGACEMLGLDPLYVANEGVFMTICANESAEAVVNTIRTYDKGAHAAVIGRVTAEHKGQTVFQSISGGRRRIDMLPGEQLPRIC